MQAHFFGNPLARFGHDLHEAACAAMRCRLLIELAFRKDYRRHERRAHAVRIRILADHIIVFQRVYEFAHNRMPPRTEVKDT